MNAKCIFVGDVYEPTGDSWWTVQVDAPAADGYVKAWAIGGAPATLEVAGIKQLQSKSFRLVKRGDGERIL